MTFNNLLRASKLLVGSALLSWPFLVFSLTVTPRPANLVAGASTIVSISGINGTVKYESSNPFKVTVTRINYTTYRIYGASSGVSKIKFKDAKSEVAFPVTVTSSPTPSLSSGILTGRLLASNCFQCHGTNGSGGFDRLTGETSAEIYSELKEFSSGAEDSSGIMAAHAMGFTDTQLKAIANYFASLR